MQIIEIFRYLQGLENDSANVEGLPRVPLFVRKNSSTPGARSVQPRTSNRLAGSLASADHSVLPAQSEEGGGEWTTMAVGSSPGRVLPHQLAELPVCGART